MDPSAAISVWAISLVSSTPLATRGKEARIFGSGDSKDTKYFLPPSASTHRQCECLDSPSGSTFLSKLMTWIFKFREATMPSSAMLQYAFSVCPITGTGGMSVKGKTPDVRTAPPRSAAATRAFASATAFSAASHRASQAVSAAFSFSSGAIAV